MTASHSYWRSADLRSLPDVSLVELSLQLDALTTNRNVCEVCSIVEEVRTRLGACADEIAARSRQQLLF